MLFYETDLLTNVTVVNEAMRFVSKHSSDNNKKKLISEGENMKESKEPDYDEKDSNKLQVKKQEGKRREKKPNCKQDFWTNLIYY